MTIAKQSHAGCHISSCSPIALNWAGLAQQKCTSVQNAKVFSAKEYQKKEEKLRHLPLGAGTSFPDLYIFPFAPEFYI